MQYCFYGQGPWKYTFSHMALYDLIRSYPSWLVHVIPAWATFEQAQSIHGEDLYSLPWRTQSPYWLTTQQEVSALVSFLAKCPEAKGWKHNLNFNGELSQMKA
jgi:hypothetical protein